jgi:hypothetical protein
MDTKQRVARLEETAGINARPKGRQRRVLELIALGTLRKAGQPCPRSFDHISDAELYQIVGMTPDVFDGAMRRFVASGRAAQLLRGGTDDERAKTS